MSVRLLQSHGDVIHTARDDLESLLYVLIWLCTKQCGPKGKRRDHRLVQASPVQDWTSKHAASMKFDLLQWPNCGARYLDAMDVYFQPLKSFIRQLIEVLFPMPGTEDKSDLAIFTEFLNVFIAAEEDFLIGHLLSVISTVSQRSAQEGEGEGEGEVQADLVGKIAV